MISKLLSQNVIQIKFNFQQLHLLNVSSFLSPSDVLVWMRFCCLTCMGIHPTFFNIFVRKIIDF